MSQHKSLQGASGLVVKRNVLKRFERVEILRKRNQWKTGDRVVGLRKTKPAVCANPCHFRGRQSPLPAFFFTRLSSAGFPPAVAAGKAGSLRYETPHQTI